MAVVGLAACESSGNGQAPEDLEANETSAGAECLKPADQSQVEACREQGAETGYVAVDYQTPFDYVARFSDTEAVVEWKVTLSEVTCGLAKAPLADSNPEWDGSNDIPTEIDAEPEEGHTFCIAIWDWENVGKQPGTPDHAGDMLLGDERHARDSEDESRSWTMMETNLGVDYSEDVNPGEKTRSLDLYQVPNGKTLDALYFPLTTFVGESIFLVATSDEPMEPVPVAGPTSAGFKDVDVDELTQENLVEIDRDVTSSGIEQAVDRHGAEAVYVAMARLDNPLFFEGEDAIEVDNSELIETGREVCREIGKDKTIDEIFMEATEDAAPPDLTTEEKDAFTVTVGDLIWSMILAAPDTLCPEHAEVKAEWEESLH